MPIKCRSPMFDNLYIIKSDEVDNVHIIDIVWINNLYGIMIRASDQLDRRFEALRPLVETSRPRRGWIKAIREALGMTTAQLAQRIGVSQPRIPVMEKAETSGSITLKSLERAAEAMGCSLVYTLVPLKPLAVTMRERAAVIADQQMTKVDQTMRLEDQQVMDRAIHRQLRENLVAELLRRPARLWDGR